VRPATGHQVKVLDAPELMTDGVAWNTQPPAGCSSRKKPRLLVNDEKTVSLLPEITGVSPNDCQFVEGRFVVDVNCQPMKLLDQENCRVEGGARDSESVGDDAWAAQAVTRAQNEK